MSIIPICIYYTHYDQDNIIASIQNPERVVDNNGKISYKCNTQYAFYNNWVLYNIFYSVIPTFRPIPEGMNIYFARIKKQDPYNITEVSILYNTFNIEDDCVYFMAWTSASPSTSLLYFYKSNNSVVPTFEKKIVNSNWDKNVLELHVLREDISVVDKCRYANCILDKTINFSCENERCLPAEKGVFLEECVTTCAIDTDLSKIIFDEIPAVESIVVVKNQKANTFGLKYIIIYICSLVGICLFFYLVYKIFISTLKD